MKSIYKQLIIILTIVIIVIIPNFFWIKNFGIKFSTNTTVWADYSTFIGGLLGPIFTIATLLFIWHQSKVDNKLLKKNMFTNEILELLENLDEIEKYYKANYKNAIAMASLDGQLHIESKRQGKTIDDVKKEMSDLKNEYLTANPEDYRITIMNKIKKSLLLSKIVFGTQSLEYIVPYLEMAKTVHKRINGGMIGDGTKMFWNEAEYYFLKSKIYKFIFLSYFEQDKILYDNWLDVAKTDLEKMKNEIIREKV